MKFNVLLSKINVKLGLDDLVVKSNSSGKKLYSKWIDPSIKIVDLTTAPANIDESLKYLFNYATVDIKDGYLGHPDSVQLKNGDILQVFPEGHGKGKIISKISTNEGKTYDKAIINPPKSWENSRETPTIYRLKFDQTQRDDMLVLVSSNPRWGKEAYTGGFNCSLSSDEGETWSEFELFHNIYEGKKLDIMVAMSSLTKLKENGKFVDKWIGTFHDRQFHNYFSTLTIDENGKANWSKPVRFFSEHRSLEKYSQMCEVEIIRSEQGQGDELCMLTRSQSKKVNSCVTFSKDEGKTWTPLRPLPDSLNGERHKAEYMQDGRLVIIYRSICRDRKTALEYDIAKNWYSRGFLLWVGTYDDIKNGKQGQYIAKVSHTYVEGQTQTHNNAHADTGYGGLTPISDNRVVISSYGRFGATQKYKNDKNKDEFKTFIISKTIKLDDLDKVVEIFSK